MSKRVIIIICACIIGLSAIFLIPKGVDEITNAVINTENGDIAFCYYDFDDASRYDALRIEVFDKNGEKLFSKSFLRYESSYADMLYYEGNLYIYLGRTEEFFALDRNGNKISELNLLRSEVQNSDSFDGWQLSFGKTSYTLGDIEYCYEEATIFKHQARLIIKTGSEEKTIYNSP